MKIEINKNNDTPLYLQIRAAIQKQILDGNIPAGYKLPPERHFSESLKVSRNTVVKAYQELISDGMVVVSVKPKGYFVKEVTRNIPERVFQPLSKMIRYNYTDKESLYNEIILQSGSEEVISLANIVINVPCPLEETVTLSELYGKREGESERLRKNIVKLLRRKDIFVTCNNVQLVTETTQGLEYIARMYLTEGDTILCEEPIVADTLNVFRNRGIHVACVRREQDGMDLEHLQSMIHLYRPKFIYTMPNLHNPTGITMSLEKRLKLLELSYAHGIPIIEENSLSDFRYEGQELPSIYSLDKGGMVLYTDTFTLTFLPGIKTAYVVGPTQPIEMMRKLVVTMEMTVYHVGHALLNQFIENGRYDRRVSLLTEYYRNRRDTMVRELLPLREKGLSFAVPDGGLCIWCALPETINEKKLFTLSREHGLLYMPGSVYFPYGYTGGGHIRLCFSNASDEEIRRGIKILSRALEMSYIRQIN